LYCHFTSFIKALVKKLGFLRNDTMEIEMDTYNRFYRNQQDENSIPNVPFINGNPKLAIQ
ncbi:hypothetical protein, partial [Chryseobacterium indologenes]|uniref:hypothetical protein n=1 Tax=Chryseobacterium indologenes TaxID=253 RepID=UPI003019D6C2